nr:reverse transcriptase domain-containing protein [Tanacetum cinerariifolium]
RGKECGFDSKEDDVVLKLDDVSLVDGVFDGAFGRDEDEDFAIRDGVCVSSSSWVRSINTFLGGIIRTFHFPVDFVVVDFDADPRVPLIPERYFLKTKRALIDVFEGELTLRVGKEAKAFNLDQTLRDGDFLFEEVDVFLALEDDPTSPEVDQSYLDSEGDILLLEAFLNDDPSLPPPNQGNYFLEVRKELKIYEAKSDKSSIDEPPK